MADLTNADIINAYANVPQHVIEGFGDEGDLARQYLLNPALFGLLGDVRDTRQVTKPQPPARNANHTTDENDGSQEDETMMYPRDDRRQGPRTTRRRSSRTPASRRLPRSRPPAGGCLPLR